MTANIVGMDAAEFPAMLPSPTAKEFQITPAALVALIEPVKSGVKPDDSREFCRGVHFFSRGGKFFAEATDGHSAHRTWVESDATGDVIVPLDAVESIVRAAQESDRMVTLSAETDRLIRYQREGLTIIARLIASRFPELDNVIPPEMPRPVLVPKARLMECLGRLGIIGAEGPSDLIATLHLTDGQIALSSRHVDRGDISERIVIEYDGEPLKIGVSRRLLANAIGPLTSDLVSFGFADELSPIVITEPEKPTQIHIVMPMRLN